MERGNEVGVVAVDGVVSTIRGPARQTRRCESAVESFRNAAGTRNAARIEDRAMVTQENCSVPRSLIRSFSQIVLDVHAGF